MPETTAPPKARKFRGRVFIDWGRCKGCGFCIEFCPPKILAFSGEFNSHSYHPPYLTKEEACTGCDLCGLYCPDFAIYGVRVPVDVESAERSEVPLGCVCDIKRVPAQEGDVH